MNSYRRIVAVTLALCFAVVVFGAYVRLSDAGLGCPDWPGCYGHLRVPAQSHLAAAEQRFPGRPFEAPKAWKEMIHRYLASTLGLLILALFALSFRRAMHGAARWLPRLLLLLVTFQGLLGMLTVTWLLKPLVVTGHLLGGLTTLSLLLWLYLSLRRQPASPAEERETRAPRRDHDAYFALAKAQTPVPVRPAPPRGLRAFAAFGLLALAAQIFLGGWTSSNYAALACPDFPTCQGRLWPRTDFREAFTLWRGLDVNYERGVLDNRARVTVHFTHRLGALTVAVVLGTLGAFLLRRSPDRGGRLLGAAVLAALGLQIAIGIAMVLSLLPLALATAHNAGAALLLLVMIAVNHHAWRENNRPVDYAASRLIHPTGAV